MAMNYFNQIETYDSNMREFAKRGDVSDVKAMRLKVICVAQAIWAIEFKKVQSYSSQEYMTENDAEDLEFFWENVDDSEWWIDRYSLDNSINPYYDGWLDTAERNRDRRRRTLDDSFGENEWDNWNGDSED